ncbi:MAG: pectate lyase [Terriglobia bacterium]
MELRVLPQRKDRDSLRKALPDQAWSYDRAFFSPQSGDYTAPSIDQSLEPLPQMKKPFRFNWKRVGTFTFVAGVLLLAPAAFQGRKALESDVRNRLKGYLNEIGNWGVQVKLSTRVGSRTGPPGIDRLSVQGRLARTLLANGELAKDGAPFLAEALAWADALVRQQRKVQTTRGAEAGFWLDSGGNLDISENGMVAAALGRAYAVADGTQKKEYAQAMERLARFLLEGMPAEPVSKIPAGATWAISAGDNKGSFAGGIKDSLAAFLPSSRSTAAAAFFFAELYAATRDKAYRETAHNALDWLLKSRHPNGEFPDLVNGKESTEVSYITTSDAAEAICSAFYLLDDSTLNKQLSGELNNTTRQLLGLQGEQGIWGEGPERLGSPGVIVLLSWFYSNPPAKPDQNIPAAVDKFWQLLTNPVHAQSFGLFVNSTATAALGIVSAEMVKPGITFKKGTVSAEMVKPKISFM